MLIRLRFSERGVAKLTPHRRYTADLAQEGSDGVLWQAQVTDWRPLLPWILSWGADVEVLAPADLREAVYEELRALAQHHGWFLSRAPGAPTAATTEFVKE